VQGESFQRPPPSESLPDPFGWDSPDSHRTSRDAVRIGLPIAAALLLSEPAAADLRPNPLFQDHAVLQRGKPIRIFGDSDPGEKIEAEFAGHRAVAVAGPDGVWELTLPALDASPLGRTLTLRGRNTVALDDIVVGDVWLCSGQSNMAFPLGSTNRPADIAAADVPAIRQFTVGMQPAASSAPTVSGKWVRSSPSAAGGFSAVAFHFARTLHRHHGGNVPIGIVVSSVGGTTIEPWLAPDGLVGKPDLLALANRPRTPSGPFSLFHGMVAPLAPFPLAGFVWYQGENAESFRSGPDSYFRKLRALADGWRQVFEDPNLPFVATQIAGWGPPPLSATPMVDPGTGWSADTRLQLARAAFLPRFGLASALDAGDADDMHPTDKTVVGERLARQAIALVERSSGNGVATGPRLRDARRVGNAVVCEFDNIGRGLAAGRRPAFGPFQTTLREPLRRFSIAGDDGKWVVADVRIEGSRLRISSTSVPKPNKVAYACWQNPEGANLYNRDGFPAEPFLIDDIEKRFTVRIVTSGDGAVRGKTVFTVLPGFPVEVAFSKAGETTVDGRSVGTVDRWVLDPVRSDTMVNVRFPSGARRHSVVAVAGPGGRIDPAGRRTVAAGGTIVFAIRPSGGNTADILLDGVPLGNRRRLAIAGVHAPHRLTVRFYGKVVATAGTGGTVEPEGEILVPAGSGRKFRIAPKPGWRVHRVILDGNDLGPVDTAVVDQIQGEHTVDAVFRPIDPGSVPPLPRPDAVWFALDAGASEPAGPFPNPTLETVGGEPWWRFRHELGNGIRVLQAKEPIPVDGVTVAVLAKPRRNGIPAAWTSLVDIFYDRIVLGIRNDTGQIVVRRNGSTDLCEMRLPEGSAVLLVLTVRRDGKWSVHADGRLAMEGAGEGPLGSLVPLVAGPFADTVAVGRNGPDAWTTFHGWIRRVRVWTAALTENERADLERNLLAP